jgi:hypothetical protein
MFRVEYIMYMGGLMIVVDQGSIDGPPKLAGDNLYGRTGQGIFGMEGSVRKSLARGSQMLWISTATRHEGETQTGRTQSGRLGRSIKL